MAADVEGVVFASLPPLGADMCMPAVLASCNNGKTNAPKANADSDTTESVAR